MDLVARRIAAPVASTSSATLDTFCIVPITLREFGQTTSSKPLLYLFSMTCGDPSAEWKLNLKFQKLRQHVHLIPIKMEGDVPELGDAHESTLTAMKYHEVAKPGKASGFSYPTNCCYLQATIVYTSFFASLRVNSSMTDNLLSSGLSIINPQVEPMCKLCGYHFHDST